MSINKSYTVKDADAAIEAQKLQDDSDTLANKRMKIDEDVERLQSQHANNKVDADSIEEKGDYAGRKNLPEIDGLQQDSQETDEVYSDPRDTAGLPPAGKNVGSLHANELSRHDN